MPVKTEPILLIGTLWKEHGPAYVTGVENGLFKRVLNPEFATQFENEQAANKAAKDVYAWDDPKYYTTTTLSQARKAYAEALKSGFPSTEHFARDLSSAQYAPFVESKDLKKNQKQVLEWWFVHYQPMRNIEQKVYSGWSDKFYKYFKTLSGSGHSPVMGQATITQRLDHKDASPEIVTAELEQILPYIKPVPIEARMDGKPASFEAKVVHLLTDDGAASGIPYFFVNEDDGVYAAAFQRHGRLEVLSKHKSAKELVTKYWDQFGYQVKRSEVEQDL